MRRRNPAGPLLGDLGPKTVTDRDGFSNEYICWLGGKCNGMWMVSCFSVRVWYVGGQLIYGSATEIESNN